MLSDPKKVSYNEALTHVIERFHHVYQANIFACSVCGKIIEPTIKIWGDEVFIKSENNKIAVGKGNKIIKDNVCNGCLRKINLSNSEVELL